MTGRAAEGAGGRSLWRPSGFPRRCAKSMGTDPNGGAVLLEADVGVVEARIVASVLSVVPGAAIAVVAGEDPGTAVALVSGSRRVVQESVAMICGLAAERSIPHRTLRRARRLSDWLDRQTQTVVAFSFLSDSRASLSPLMAPVARALQSWLESRHSERDSLKLVWNDFAVGISMEPGLVERMSETLRFFSLVTDGPPGHTHIFVGSRAFSIAMVEANPSVKTLKQAADGLGELLVEIENYVSYAAILVRGDNRVMYPTQDFRHDPPVPGSMSAFNLRHEFDLQIPDVFWWQLVPDAIASVVGSEMRVVTVGSFEDWLNDTSAPRHPLNEGRHRFREAIVSGKIVA